MIILSFYGFLKLSSLITRQNVDVVISIAENAFDHQYILDSEYGVDLAIAITAYDSETEVILNKTIGELNFMAYEWGEDENGEVYVKREIIPSY